MSANLAARSRGCGTPSDSQRWARGDRCCLSRCRPSRPTLVNNPLRGLCYAVSCCGGERRDAKFGMQKRDAFATEHLSRALQ